VPVSSPSIKCVALLESNLKDVELVRNVDSMKVGLVALQEVDDVPLSLGKADPDVEGVNLLVI
jgi:hypothetical protein